MSYTAIGSGSITLNAMSAEKQKNLQEALMNRYDRLRTADLAQCGDDMAYQIEREYQELTQAMLKYNDPFWWLTVVFKEAGFTEVERNPNDVALSIELSYCNNYYEDMILELLNTLVAPYYIERVSVHDVPHIVKAKKAIRRALQNQIDGKGYSFIEVLSMCPTNWGVDAQTGADWVRDVMQPYYPLGVFRDKDAEEASRVQ